MKFYVTNFKWIMLLAGLLTCTMFLALFSPQSSLMSNFGQGLDGPVANLIVRNWGALIGITGLALIYGAFVENVRRFALVLAMATAAASSSSSSRVGCSIAGGSASLMTVRFT